MADFHSNFSAPSLQIQESLPLIHVQGEGSFLLRPLDFKLSPSHLVFSNEEDPLCEDTYIPASVIHSPNEEVDRSWLASAISRFKTDPEYSDIFLQVVILKASSSSITSFTFSSPTEELLDGFPCKRFYISTDSNTAGLPEGPFFVRKGQIYQQWKLYEDIYDAFHLPTIQDPQDTQMYEAFTRKSLDGHFQIAVPSRLHFQRTAEKPLNGIRIAIKDVFDVKGVKTSGQSRSYNQLYGPTTNSAPPIQRLLDLGAIIVGKVKCTQFGSSEQPTADWIETLCPWNPRGDGLLNPRGSSTGSGVAVAGYSWIDASVGSDTSGSNRGPAAAMGVFGNRPSHGLLPLDGMTPCSQLLDTIGFMTRHAELFHSINTQLYPIPVEISAETRPKRLLYLEDYLPYDNPNAQEVMDSFVTQMSQFLGLSVERINLAKLWEDHNPTGNGISLKDHVTPIMNTLIWAGYDRNYAKFRQDYREKFNADAYVNPVIKFAWERGAAISNEIIEEVENARAIYKQWMEDVVFRCKDGPLEAIAMYPVGDPEPVYRDNYRLPPEKLTGYNWWDKEDHQACLAELPAIVVPIGQTAYLSRVSGNREHMPVSISIMGPRYSDHCLTQLVQDMLKATGLPLSVKTGKTPFEVSGFAAQKP